MWYEKANCYGVSEETASMAFGDSQDENEPHSDEDALRFIRVYCQDCPVKQLCLEAGKEELYGVWGGLMPSERISKSNAKRNKKAARKK